MTTFSEYANFDGVGLAALLREGEVSQAEVLQSAIEQIENGNAALNAVIHQRFEKALDEAQAPLGSGPFAGVPFLLKDLNILFKGEPTSNGSHYWRDNIAHHDSTMMARYRDAGLIVLGFTNTAELGLACETAPDAYGPTRNPWDLSRSAGGSSGGAAVAVAAGFVPAAHATDGGGSIRIPSSNTGVFGLKPTRGRNPYGPDAGEGWNGLSTHHVVTRSVRDSAAFLDVSHGAEPGDPYAAPAFTGRFADAVRQDPKTLRIAFQSVDHEGRAVDPSCVRAVHAAAVQLAALGHDVEEIRPTVDGFAMRRATRVIVASNVAAVLERRARVLGRPTQEEDVEPITWRWGLEGSVYTGVQLAQAIGVIHGLGRELGRFFETYDVLLTPTFATPPLPLKTVDMQNPDLDDFYEALRRHSAFTSIYNCAGTPAASVPLYWENGLPIGVQIAAALGQDALILALAAQLERAHPWQRQRPPTLTNGIY